MRKWSVAGRLGLFLFDTSLLLDDGGAFFLHFGCDVAGRCRFLSLKLDQRCVIFSNFDEINDCVFDLIIYCFLMTF